jgi:enterochelin esterase-like enzyme
MTMMLCILSSDFLLIYWYLCIINHREKLCMKYFPFLFFVAVSFAQPSRIELKNHFSATLSTTKEFNIFFPEGYDSETDRYPVVYLFRGAVDEWADPSEDAARRGNIKTVFDSLYLKKKVDKMILIMPGLGAPAAQNEYTYLVNDLIPYIDANYRTIPGRWHRAMDGFSLGGSIVTNLLASVPQLFCSVGSYDGTLNSPYFDNTKFSNASSTLIYAIKQIQLLYHTGSVGGNNNSNNQAVFNILNAKGIYNSLPSFVLDPNAQHNWFYADWHVAITLPLHWQKLHSAENNLNLALKKQYTEEVLSGTQIIEWSRKLFPDDLTTYLFYSKNSGKDWTSFFSTKGNDSSATLNTALLSDGTRYKLKIITVGDSLYGSYVTGTFTINNPGNAAPDVNFAFMNEGETISGMCTLIWNAADADGDALSISLDLSHNGGFSWSSIATSVPNNGVYDFDTKPFPNSNNLLFRITCSDGLLSSQSVSPKQILFNKRLDLSNAIFTHVNGHSDAVIKAMGMSIESLHTANYSIIFKESLGEKTYSVFNTNGIEVVKDATELDGKTEGPLFDGFRLLVSDLQTPTVNVDSTRWIVGTSNLMGEIRLIDIITESGTVTAIPFPSDYEIRISNTIVDTSLALYGAGAVHLNFLVWNTTLNRKTKFVFGDFDANGALSEFDELYLMEKDSLNNTILTWHVQFIASSTAINPISGDKFKIRIMKPLTKSDSYQFHFTPPLSTKREQSLPTKYSLSQNYPNPFNPSTMIEFSVLNNEFVSMTVFDILGRKIQTLLNEKITAGVHKIKWNAEQYSNGVYFYRIQTKQFNQTKKMILAK